MLNNNFGWIVDKDHPIKPKPDKNALIDLAIGLGITAIGIGWTVVTTFLNGGHAYQNSEFDILQETGKLIPIDKDESYIEYHDKN